MSSEETVKLEVTLGLSYCYGSNRSEEWDTGITLEDWNEMSAEARQRKMVEAYQETLANYDNGGVRVVTEGAKD